jgi:hypothetical protein
MFIPPESGEAPSSKSTFVNGYIPRAQPDSNRGASTRQPSVTNPSSSQTKIQESSSPKHDILSVQVSLIAGDKDVMRTETRREESLLDDTTAEPSSIPRTSSPVPDPNIGPDDDIVHGDSRKGTAESTARTPSDIGHLKFVSQEDWKDTETEIARPEGSAANAQGDEHEAEFGRQLSYAQSSPAQNGVRNPSSSTDDLTSSRSSSRNKKDREPRTDLHRKDLPSDPAAEPNPSATPDSFTRAGATQQGDTSRRQTSGQVNTSGPSDAPNSGSNPTPVKPVTRNQEEPAKAITGSTANDQVSSILRFVFTRA